MRTIKKENPSAVDFLLNRLEQRPSDSKNIRQDAGSEGVKLFALNDAIQSEVIKRFPNDRMAQGKIGRSIMSMKMDGMSEEEIYKSFTDGSFDEKAAANDPFSNFK